LSFAGNLTTSRAEALRSEVMAAVGDHPSITIDCSNATEMDVTFVQILVAASRFASQRGKTIALAAPPAGLLADTLRRSGFPAPEAPTAVLAEVLSLRSM
jgi:phospholipid transport system transporter-binding protein